MSTHPDDSFAPPVSEWYPPSPDVLNNAIIQNYDQVYREAASRYT